MSISAMKYALDVLDNYVEDPRCETHCVTAIHFLRQAIAEAEDAVAAEREACAKLCEAADIGYKEAHFDMADYLANAIRARGEK